VGIQDRDYMRERRLRWDERSGEMRLDDVGQSRELAGRWNLIDWVVMLATAAGGFALAGAAFWFFRNPHVVVDVETAGPVAVAEVVPAAPSTLPAVSTSGNCRIKGNISGSGHIYHVPGSASYNATRIDTSKGERWFCSEEEAEAAGWVRPRS
jgi:hypothetical protein